MDVEGVEEFIAGMLYSLIGKDDLPDIKSCLKDAEDIEVQVMAALSDIAKLDLNDIIKGVEELGQVIKELPKDLKGCESMAGDLAKIEAWAKIFEHPVALVATLTKNTIKHWGNITMEVNQTEVDFKAKQYYECGEDVGEIVVLTVGPMSQPASVEEDMDWTLFENNLALF
uniref:Uncharacterized protein n=1 Tax=Strombidium inclinatum TaxID=197538 RepID=A0A7S3IUC5_9SPIT